MSLKRALFYVLMSFALAAFGAYLTRAAEAPPRWRYSDRVYAKDNRTPMGLDYSQKILKDIAMSAGHTDPVNRAVFGLDGPRANAGRVRHIVAMPAADTLWFALLGQEYWMPGECCYIGVVEEAVAPDSVRLYMMDGSMVMVTLEGKGKGR
jgi:hypothetical protein